MNARKLIIIGAGKYGREIEDIAEQTHAYDDIKFLDDNATGQAIIGKCADIPLHVGSDVIFYVAFGDNDLRSKLIDQVQRANGKLACIIHPSAYISPKAKIGQGVAIMPMAIVNTNTVIGLGCMINSGAIVDHDVILEPFVHVCVGAIVKADNRVPEKMKIEAGYVVERDTYQYGAGGQ